MKSCIFEGRVRHRRHQPVAHGFRYRVFMMYLDLDELPALFDRYWCWSARRPAFARFRREDHVGDPDVPLDEAVRDLVEVQSGTRPDGPIRLLTHLCYFGYCFNPVSFYYCFEDDGTTLATIVAEVTNTPWGERHCYVLPAGRGHERNGVLRLSARKAMHVSPFIDMDCDYDFRFTPPGDQLRVFMGNDRDGQRVFDAGMLLERRPIGSATLARVLVAYPLMTLRVMFAIHWQAFRLWLKGAPVYAHPDKRYKTVSTR